MKFQLSFVAAVLSLVFAAAAAPTPADASVAPTGLSHVAPVLSPAVLDAAPLDVANAGSPVLDVYASLSQLVPKLDLKATLLGSTSVVEAVSSTVGVLRTKLGGNERVENSLAQLEELLDELKDTLATKKPVEQIGEIFDEIKDTIEVVMQSAL